MSDVFKIAFLETDVDDVIGGVKTIDVRVDYPSIAPLRTAGAEFEFNDGCRGRVSQARHYDSMDALVRNEFDHVEQIFPGFKGDPDEFRRQLRGRVLSGDIKLYGLLAIGIDTQFI